MSTAPVAIHSEVKAALADGRPVVALETAVVTHGLPRVTLPPDRIPTLPHGIDWETGTPANLAAARLLDRIVRAEGVVPATVAVLDGTVHIGLDDAALERLARDRSAEKAAARDLPATMALRQSAGTTVSGTLAACRAAATRGSGEPIRVFATGGIGGVHRGWAKSGDVSADLHAIATTPICVVSAGAKSILDLRLTLEMLDTLSVPVVGLGTDRFPRFHAVGDERLRVPLRLDDFGAVAALCAHRWRDLASGGVLLAVPVPESEAIDLVEVETVIAVAEERARKAKVRGAALTPFLLEAMADESGGRLVRANLALLVNNAVVACGVARELATTIAARGAASDGSTAGGGADRQS